MNETLKGVANIGAELAAAKADLQRELERHRKTWRQLEQVTGLLREIRDVFSTHRNEVGDYWTQRIDAALSQQAEPVEPAPVNQCDGCQAGVPVDENGNHRMGKPGGYADLMRCEKARYVSEPAPAQDERERVAAALRACDWSGTPIGIKAIVQRACELLTTRPAQTEQQPSAAQQILDLIMEECRYWHGRDEARRGNFASLYAQAKEIADNAAPIAQTAPQPEQSEHKRRTLQWVVDRWHAEVANRPLVNVHRRTLDSTWRQMIRYLGEDDVVLLGPRHDDMLDASGNPLPQYVAATPSPATAPSHE